MSTPALCHHVSVLGRPHRDVRDAEDAAHEVKQRLYRPFRDVLFIIFLGERRRAAAVIVVARRGKDELGELFELEARDAREEGVRAAHVVGK